MCPQDSQAEVLGPRASVCDCVWRQASKEVMRVKRGHWGGPWSSMTVSLEEDIRTQTHTRMALGGHGKMPSAVNERGPGGKGPGTPWFWTSASRTRIVSFTASALSRGPVIHNGQLEWTLHLGSALKGQGWMSDTDMRLPGTDVQRPSWVESECREGKGQMDGVGPTV